MERAVYFDAWFPRQHCYHPSLPARRLRMIEDLEEYRATILVWSSLGGGSISLPYLEREAHGPIDPRFRFYGYVNDFEFIKEAHKRGIKVLGIVFEAQGWEFPVELSENEDEILSLNEPRGVGKHDWIGLREFSQNRYPRLWKPLESYFPGGLVNSAGENVTDLIAECCSRDIYGQPCHARWVECPDREHQCFLMDRNNPVWREYLKAVIRIQIDAGVDGIQLDETELPIGSMFYGGCFCHDCIQGFREHLKRLPPGQLPAELSGVDLDTFHYGEWLLARGYDFKSNREHTPLIWEYLRFQREAIKKYFAELARYAHDYAATQGRTTMVSGNFYNLFDQFYSLKPDADIIITEMQNTRYRQPDWYRYVAGFVGDKTVIVAENPFGGVIPDLVSSLQIGKAYDLFRLSIYEAVALGTNMSLPYGSWMGNVIQDAFYAPHPLCVEIQHFLADHEFLYSQKTSSDTAVIYSIESNFKPVTRHYLFKDDNTNLSALAEIPFWNICQKLSSASQPYDVVFFPDGGLSPDTLSQEDISQYRTLILPDCWYITSVQADLLFAHLQKGNYLLILGEFGKNLPETQRQRILNHPDSIQTDAQPASLIELLPAGPQLRLSKPVNMAVNLQRLETGVALHLIRYDFSPEMDCVPVLEEITLELRLPDQFNTLEIYSPGEKPEANLSVMDNHHRIVLKGLSQYCIIQLTKERSSDGS